MDFNTHLLQVIFPTLHAPSIMHASYAQKHSTNEYILTLLKAALKRNQISQLVHLHPWKENLVYKADT